MYFLFCLKTVCCHLLFTVSAWPEIGWHQISVICCISCRVRHLPESWKVVTWQSLSFLSTWNREKMCKKGFVCEGSRLIGRLPAIWLISVSGGGRGQNAKTFPLFFFYKYIYRRWLLWFCSFFFSGTSSLRTKMRRSLMWLLPREKRQVAKTAIRALHKNLIFLLNN